MTHYIMCITTFRSDVEFRCTSILANVLFKRLHQEHALRRYVTACCLDADVNDKHINRKTCIGS
jgi:hypothetical protein